MLTEKWKR